jgi:hypothetical protein
MDPYLEDPDEWQGVHNTLITYLWSALNAVLPPEYIARAEVRCYISYMERQGVPDLTVRHRLSERPSAVLPASSGTTATLLLPDEPLIVETEPYEIREAYIDITRAKDRERIVTTIELLSPTNKAANSTGRRLYRHKQEQLLSSRTHLIEIDLLRQGEHTVAVPRELLPEPHWDFIVCLHRGGQSAALEVWKSTLRERLPRIKVPLDPEYPDVTLDLQAIFNRYYDDGGYLRDIDYRREPIPPLRAEDVAWADTLLRSRSLRP